MQLWKTLLKTGFLISIEFISKMKRNEIITYVDRTEIQTFNTLLQLSKYVCMYIQYVYGTYMYLM